VVDERYNSENILRPTAFHVSDVMDAVRHVGAPGGGTSWHCPKSRLY
jgi:hypothetical protein